MFEMLAWYYVIGLILISAVVVWEGLEPDLDGLVVAVTLWPLVLLGVTLIKLDDHLARREWKRRNA